MKEISDNPIAAYYCAIAVQAVALAACSRGPESGSPERDAKWDSDLERLEKLIAEGPIQ